MRFYLILQLIFDTRSSSSNQNSREGLSNTAPKPREATDVEKSEEFTFEANTFAPQHNKRVPRGTALVTKRVPLTAADKKKVNKSSIGLPILGTLKLASGNGYPFTLKNCVPREAICRSELINNRNDSGLTTVSEARRPRLSLTPLPLASAVQQRISLGGTTLCSIADQATAAAPQESVRVTLEHRGDHPTPVDTVLQIRVRSHSSYLIPEVALRINTWLEDSSTPTATEPDSSSLATQLQYSEYLTDIEVDEDVWELIERDCRQRKSLSRQMPNTMSIEANDNSVRGSNITRPSASYSNSRSGDSHTHPTANAIKDYPGTSARRPKTMPSGSQLPSCWNDDMDQFICHMEAQCEFSIRTIIKALKQRFAELREVSAWEI